MKKKYEIPTSIVVELHAEGAIAIAMSDNTISSTTEIRTNRRGWDSLDWSGVDADWSDIDEEE